MQGEVHFTKEPMGLGVSRSLELLISHQVLAPDKVPIRETEKEADLLAEKEGRQRQRRCRMEVNRTGDASVK